MRLCGSNSRKLGSPASQSSAINTLPSFVTATADKNRTDDCDSQVAGFVLRARPFSVPRGFPLIELLAPQRRLLHRLIYKRNIRRRPKC